MVQCFHKLNSYCPLVLLLVAGVVGCVKTNIRVFKCWTYSVFGVYWHHLHLTLRDTPLLLFLQIFFILLLVRKLVYSLRHNPYYFASDLRHLFERFSSFTFKIIAYDPYDILWKNHNLKTGILHRTNYTLICDAKKIEEKSINDDLTTYLFIDHICGSHFVLILYSSPFSLSLSVSLNYCSLHSLSALVVVVYKRKTEKTISCSYWTRLFIVHTALTLFIVNQYFTLVDITTLLLYSTYSEYLACQVWGSISGKVCVVTSFS